MRRILIRLSILAGTLAIAAAGVAVSLHREESERLPKALAEKAGLSSEALKSRARRTAQPEERVTYVFSRKIRANLAGKTLADLSYSGRIFVDESAPTSDGSKVSRLSFALDGQPLPAVSLRMTLDSDGKLLALEEPARDLTEAETDALSVLKDLASILAYSTFEDTLGRYDAKVSVSGNTFVKSKLRYEETRVTGIEILRSRHEVEWKLRNEAPIRYSGEEETRVGLAREGMDTYSSYTLMLEGADRTLASRNTSPAEAEWRETRLPIEALGSIAPKVNWETIQARLTDVETLASQPRLAFFHQTLRSLKQNPEKTFEMKDWVLKTRKQVKSARFGIGVLATHGTPDAQRALREIYSEFGRSPETRGLQHTILSSLTTTEAKLDSDTREFLGEIAMAKDEEPELAMNAAFAIGSAIKKEPDPRDEKKLIELAASASDLDEKLAYIDAIGNSGSENLLPALEESLQSENARLRAKAVFALRWMKTEAAMKRAEEFLQDSSPVVRTAAERALRYQRGES